MSLVHSFPMQDLTPQTWLVSAATVTGRHLQRAGHLWRTLGFGLPPVLLPNRTYLAARHLDTCRISTIHNHIQLLHKP